MSLHLVTGYAGQAHIKAANHGAYNAAVVGSGKYVLDSGNMMAASVLSANKIRIYDGICLNQGRHIQIDPDTYEEVDIENGTQGYMRNDIIVMRYSKDAETDIETPSLVVIKGTPAEVSPTDPEHAEGNILNGALVDDMPLYRVPLDGLTVGELVPLFDIKPSLDNMIVSDLDEMSAITEAGKYAADAKAVGELKSDLDALVNEGNTVVTEFTQNPTSLITFVGINDISYNKYMATVTITITASGTVSAWTKIGSVQKPPKQTVYICQPLDSTVPNVEILNNGAIMARYNGTGSKSVSGTVSYAI